MSVSLEKFRYAVGTVDHMEFRGEIVALGVHTVRIRVCSATGLSTRTDYSSACRGSLVTLPRQSSDLYR